MILISKFIILLTSLSVYRYEYYNNQSKTQIKNPDVLRKYFKDVSECKFPTKLEISFINLLSNGMLFTTFDQNKNFLYAELNNNHLIIYYDKKELKKPLDVLCNCKTTCSYEKLNLTFWNERNSSYTKCNYGKRYKLTENNTRRAKPNVIFPKLNVSNQAYLWVINHEFYPYLKPYSKQLITCILHLKYKDKVLEMTLSGRNINSNCPRSCKGRGKCSGGKCIETYSKVIVCNCTRAAYNGPRCNIGIKGGKPVNIQMRLKYPLLKISWKTNNDVIMKITGYHSSQYSTDVIIKNVRSSLIIKVIHIHENRIPNEEKKVLMKDYYPNENINTMVFHFNGNQLIITSSNKHVLKFHQIDKTKEYPKVEVFGAIALGYKVNIQMTIWKNLVNFTVVEPNSNIQQDKPSVTSINCNQCTNKKNINIFPGTALKITWNSPKRLIFNLTKTYDTFIKPTLLIVVESNYDYKNDLRVKIFEKPEKSIES